MISHVSFVVCHMHFFLLVHMSIFLSVHVSISYLPLQLPHAGRRSFVQCAATVPTLQERGKGEVIGEAGAAGGGKSPREEEGGSGGGEEIGENGREKREK